MTGEGTPYTEAEEADLADYLAGLDYWDAVPAEDDEIGVINIEAQIEWSGELADNGRGGVRQTNLGRNTQRGGVPLGEIRKAVERLRAARISGPDQPYRSYRAKSWHAQLRQMRRTTRGRELLADSGIPLATIRRWGPAGRGPGRANREKLAAAYEDMRNPRPAAVRQARHELTEAFTKAVDDTYGVTVRARDIHQLWIVE